MKSVLGLVLGVPFLIGVTGLTAAACGADTPATEGPTPPDGGIAPDAMQQPPPVDTRDAAPDVAPPEAPLGFSVRGAALFQGVKLPLFGEKAKDAPLPVVVARPGVVRFYVDLRAASEPQQPHVRFRYRAADGTVQTLEVTQPITADSIDTNDETCLDVPLPAAAFHAALAYQAEVTDAAGRLVSRFPEAADTFAPLPANPATQTVHVVVVPVEYTADDSHRLPDTSPAQLERLAGQMHALYPVSTVDVTVRAEPLVWPNEVGAGGNGWDELLYGVLHLRETDAVADDVYYYGAFEPGSSLSSFCASGGFGCVLGLSELSHDIDDAGRRGSIGLGYTGKDAAETFAHEVGHAHGRFHAPCGGAGGPDAKFPYPGGGIGAVGWDVRTGEFVQSSGRTAAKDFMGYCDPAWVSDYTWQALFTRIVGVSEKAHPVAQVAPLARPVSYRLLRVQDGVAPRWVGARAARGVVSEQHESLTVGGKSVEVPSVTLDHLPGQVLYVPATLAGQRVVVGGATLTVP